MGCPPTIHCGAHPTVGHILRIPLTLGTCLSVYFLRSKCQMAQCPIDAHSLRGVPRKNLNAAEAAGLHPSIASSLMGTQAVSSSSLQVWKMGGSHMSCSAPHLLPYLFRFPQHSLVGVRVMVIVLDAPGLEWINERHEHQRPDDVLDQVVAVEGPVPRIVANDEELRPGETTMVRVSIDSDLPTPYRQPTPVKAVPARAQANGSRYHGEMLIRYRQADMLAMLVSTALQALPWSNSKTCRNASVCSKFVVASCVRWCAPQTSLTSFGSVRTTSFKLMSPGSSLPILVYPNSVARALRCWSLSSLIAVGISMTTAALAASELRLSGRAPADAYALAHSFSSTSSLTYLLL